MNHSDEEIRDVLEQLSLLAPGENDAPESVAQVLARVKKDVSTEGFNPVRDFLRRLGEMTNRKTLAVGTTLIMAVVILFGFPSVRAAANDFLGLFRVQKFAPISISPDQLAVLEQLGEQGMSPGELVFDKEPGEPDMVGTLSAASDRSGYAIRTAPSLGEPTEIYVLEDAKGYLTIDLAGARAIVQAVGVDPMLLPDSLDGARIDVNVYDSVQQMWPDGTMLMQTISPDVAYPEDIDPAVLGEALLQVLGTEPEAAHRIAQNIDWTSTLVLPIPQELATYQDVTIDGVTGVAVIPLDGSSETAVMWQKDGMIYVLGGANGIDELISLANTLQ